MLDQLDKQSLFDEVLGRLKAQLEELTRAQKATQAGVTHEDNRAEGDKDMRSTEASYVARGQAARVEQLGDEVREVQAVRVRKFTDESPLAWGALFSLEASGGVTSHHLLLPAGAGLRLQRTLGALEIEISVVSSRSPLGQALLGARLGDSVSLDRADLSREWDVTEVG
jgi:transcription elongation GreA/GreB family factor